jgi:hypothetical protein
MYVSLCVRGWRYVCMFDTYVCMYVCVFVFVCIYVCMYVVNEFGLRQVFLVHRCPRTGIKLFYL